MQKQKIRYRKNRWRIHAKHEEMQENSNTLYVAKVFYQWFEERMVNFKYKPKLKHKDSISVEYTFEGICPKITLCINFSWVEAMICYSESDTKDELWSIHKVLEYIGIEEYDPQKGYYDADRIDGKYTYFSSKEELYINEVFETIPEYCEAYLKPGMYIYTSKRLNGFTATIAPKSDSIDDVRGWWGAIMFFGEIEGDEEAVNYLKEHDSYNQVFDLFSCEEVKS